MIMMWEQVGQSRSKERKIKEREGKEGCCCSPCILPPPASEESSEIMRKGSEGREEKISLSSQSLCDTLKPEK